MREELEEMCMIIWRKIIECNFGKLIYRKKRYKKTVKEIEEERGRLTRTNDWCFIELQEEESSEKAVRVKELEEERGRLTRTNAAQTTQIDKFKKLAEDCKSKADSLETQLTATKKVHIVLVELLKF